MITAHKRGHLIIFTGGRWVYADNQVPIDEEERACIKCGKMPTPEGYDACLGYIKDATSACCGHGIEKPYIIKSQVTTIK